MANGLLFVIVGFRGELGESDRDEERYACEIRSVRPRERRMLSMRCNVVMNTGISYSEVR